MQILNFNLKVRQKLVVTENNRNAKMSRNPESVLVPLKK